MKPNSLRKRTLCQVGVVLWLLSTAAVAGDRDICSQRDRSAIEQMLIVKIPEATGASRSLFLSWLAERNIGGVFLSKRSTRNLRSPAEVREYIAALQAARQTGLFVSVDQEGGSRQGLDATNGFAALPGASDICKMLRGDAVIDFAQKSLGQPLAAVGVNMNFAPVLDVALDAKSDIIVRKGRACSDDPAHVAAYGRNISEGLISAGLIPVGKHFPGHGDVTGDTHDGVVLSDKSVADLEAEDLVPFKAFIEGHGPAIMVAHIIVTAIDDTAPASMSKPVLSGLLRERYGFKGLVITDDLTMRAVTQYTNGQTAVAARLAILAGANLLVMSQSNADHVVRKVCQALSSDDGTALRGRISNGNKIIKEIKQRFGIRTAAAHDLSLPFD